MSARILIVDDEPDLLAAVEYALKREGFDVRTAANGLSALDRAIQDPHPQLVLLDLMLPDIPGTEVFRRLRADSRTAGIPIIMLTAKGDEIDRVVGLELGADDYVVKPFSTRELVLRIRAVLRRSTPNETDSPARDRHGVLEVDAAGYRCWVDGKELGLTALEFKLLLTLFRRKGRVYSRDKLLAKIWDSEAELGTRTVDTHVKRLRHKLGPAKDYIETVRGVGYRFTDQIR